MSTWIKTKIKRDNGEIVDAVSPYIISASRSTDIPAFYSDWFFHRLEVGYSAWINPFNNQRSYISYDKCKFIVFWSKNPESLLNLQYKKLLDERNIKIYIQYTMNDYEDECLEDNIQSLNHRIEVFKKLSDMYGKDSVIWRFDPLVLTDKISIFNLLIKINNIADQIKDYTNKLVFSFVDIAHYPKVQKNLDNYGVNYKEWTVDEMNNFADKLNMLRNMNKWSFDIATCSEKIDLDEYNIKHNKCVDDELITKIAWRDSELMNFLGMQIHRIGDNLLDDSVPEDAVVLDKLHYAIRTKSNRDSGQRLLCGCINSKDIGQYSTCIHRCAYCYANTNNDIAQANYNKHLLNKFSETINGE